jgi:hypothetical protein
MLNKAQPYDDKAFTVLSFLRNRPIVRFFHKFTKNWPFLTHFSTQFYTVRNNFRCGIGIFPLRAFSDTTSEIISNRVDTFALIS